MLRGKKLGPGFLRILHQKDLSLASLRRDGEKSRIHKDSWGLLANNQRKRNANPCIWPKRASGIGFIGLSCKGKNRRGSIAKETRARNIRAPGHRFSSFISTFQHYEHMCHITRM